MHWFPNPAAEHYLEFVPEESDSFILFEVLFEVLFEDLSEVLSEVRLDILSLVRLVDLLVV